MEKKIKNRILRFVFTILIISIVILSGLNFREYTSNNQENSSSRIVETNDEKNLQDNDINDDLNSELKFIRDETGEVIRIGIPVDQHNLRNRKPSLSSSTSISGKTRGQWDSIIMEDDFEDANWDTKYDTLEDKDPNSNGDWWGRDNDAPYVKNGSYSLNSTKSFSGPGQGGAGVGYDNNMAAWMIYGPFDLSSTAPFKLCAKLTFWYWLDCEPNINNDYLFFGASNGTAVGGLIYYELPKWILPAQRTDRIRSWRWVDYNLTDT
ncbi:MAG: hypothetical protein KAJ51_05905, partial [Thermoplasmata archaeon]|nr:hypothetical protein [Thermoplasmata archaeon]